MSYTRTTSFTRAATLAVVAAALVAVPHAAGGQGWGDRLKRTAEEAAKRAAEARVERRAKDAANAAMDAAEGAAGGAVRKDSAAAKPAVTASSATAAATAPTPPAATTSTAAAAAERPGDGAWANYDFMPGARVLFADDFSADKVGDFPRRVEFKAGNMEVVEWRSARYLRVNPGTGKFYVALPEVLPERFTVEFDYAGMNKYELMMTFTDALLSGNQTPTRVKIGAWGAGLDGAGVTSINAPSEASIKGVAKVRVMADGKYVKVYVDDKRVANVPNASLGRSNKILFEVPVMPNESGLIANVRVAAGGADLYDAIAEKGRVTTHGIYFDTGKDVLRAESTPTLKEIAGMLAAHPELKLAIEGHTDNAGDAATNQSLSERRAAAVKAALVESFGADAARLTAQGLGATKPAAPNTTAEGRQQNRRVELAKQ